MIIKEHEIDINDFANSWYLHVNDANCEYTVELGRRPKYYNSEKHVNIQNDYLYVTSSNVIEAPNAIKCTNMAAERISHVIWKLRVAADFSWIFASIMRASVK